MKKFGVAYLKDDEDIYGYGDYKYPLVIAFCTEDECIKKAIKMRESGLYAIPFRNIGLQREVNWSFVKENRIVV